MGQVIVRLLGGLGNQMFQYAAGRALALYQGSALWLDDRALQADGPHTRRAFALGAFDIRAARADAPRLQGFKGRALSEAGPRFDAAVTRAEGDVYLAGYWQCERYFAAIRPLLQRDFALRDQPGAPARAVAESIGRAETSGAAAVALHVRRGDYLSNPQAAAHHGVCEPGYYRAALAELKRRHGAIEVFAFTDDPAWLDAELPRWLAAVDRETGGETAWHLVSGAASAGAAALSDHEELALMRRCRHFVIANSSFSWWGAWLGETPQSTVIAPRQWVRNPGFDTRDVVPERWLQL